MAHSGVHVLKKNYDVLSRSDTISERDRRADSIAVLISRVSITVLTRDKNDLVHSIVIKLG